MKRNRIRLMAWLALNLMMLFLTATSGWQGGDIGLMIVMMITSALIVRANWEQPETARSRSEELNR
jgi:hypothetical protein